MLEYPIKGGTQDFSGISFADGNWTTLFVGLSILLMTLNVVVYRRHFVLSLKAIYSTRSFSQLSKEGKIFEEGTFMMALPAVVITFGLAVVQLSGHFLPQLSLKWSFPEQVLLVAAVFFALYFLKLIINYIFFSLFDVPESRYLYNLYDYSLLLSLALTLLVAATVAQYARFYFIYYLFFVEFFMLFLLKVYHFFLLKPKKLGLFYFFVYFCTLEILPYLVIVKLFFTLGK